MKKAEIVANFRFLEGCLRGEDVSLFSLGDNAGYTPYHRTTVEPYSSTKANHSVSRYRCPALIVCLRSREIPRNRGGKQYMLSSICLAFCFQKASQNYFFFLNFANMNRKKMHFSRNFLRFVAGNSDLLE